MGAVCKLRILADELDINMEEAKRYMGYAKGADVSDAEDILKRAHDDIKSALKPSVCYTITFVKIAENLVDFGLIQMKSDALSRNLKGCGSAFLFAATAGPLVDRLIAKKQRFSLAEGAIYDAVGSAAAEAVCNEACRRFEEMAGSKPKPRFSPGYGDLDISIQPDFLRVLDAGRKCGITLTDNYLMAPLKSVTAIAGIKSQN